MKRRKICLGAAAAVGIIAVALFGFIRLSAHPQIVIRDGRTGDVLYRCQARPGTECSVEFKHSVNKTPVRDEYVITEDGSFHNLRCVYYGFGAGVQTELEGEETLRYEDGAMIIENIQKYYPKLSYGILPVSTHVFRTGDTEIRLADLIESAAIVEITYESH